VSQHLYPVISNIRLLLDNGFAESLDNALTDEIPQRDHLLSHSERKSLSALDKLPHWLEAAYAAFQKMTTPELRVRKQRYLNGHLIDISSAKTKRTQPRGLRLCTESVTTAFWVNLVIACDGPATDDSPPGLVANRSSKTNNQLPNAMQDLAALSEFYRPVRIGDPNVVFAGSAGRSEGFFDRTVVLANPLVREVKQALDVLMHWVSINSNDPEFDFFHINLIYSGHAYRGESFGESNLFLGTAKLSTKDLVEGLIASTERQDVRCPRATVSVFLDCCYSAAIARDIVVHLQNMQDEAWRASSRPLYACSKLYCSSLDDEASFDEIGLGHSYFVAAYLRENSLGKTSTRWPLLHEIALRTSFAQNPVLFSLADGGMRIRFPSLQLLKNECKDAWQSEELGETALRDLIRLQNLRPSQDGFLDVNPVDFELAKLREMRKAITGSENRATAPEIRVPSYKERVHYWLF
jgi:hypothetical protein